jgi:hypothetical protein
MGGGGREERGERRGGVGEREREREREREPSKYSSVSPTLDFPFRNPRKDEASIY